MGLPAGNKYRWSIVAFVAGAVVISSWSVFVRATEEVALPATPTSSPHSPTPTPTSEAHEVVLALSSLVEDPATLAASGTEDLVGDVQAIFPPDTTATANEESWQPDGTGSGGTITVVVTEPDGTVTSYLTLMVREAGAWKVLATIEADD